jgi:orotate phosphoribosyltransferase
MSKKSDLLELLRKHAVKFGSFTLASGKQSDFFVDCKQVVLTSGGHKLVGAVMYNEIVAEEEEEEFNPDCYIEVVAGVALGGCPLASAVSMHSVNLHALYVRKEAKDHGTKRLVEGVAEYGARVALLEDVVTTGSSSLAAAETLKKLGFEVPVIIALVDREEGGAEAIRAAGYAFRSVFKRSDFGAKEATWG